MSKKIFTFLFVFLSLINSVFAATYYVNYSTGSDSNAGTSGSPFKTMTPVSGTNFLNPGDTVNIIGSNTFTNNDCYFQINSSGAPGNPITINGTGTAPIFDCATPTSSITGWTGWTENQGTYTFTVTSANATAGAVYSNNGVNFTVQTTISGGTTLTTHAPGAPTSSGTLTLVSGTGDSTITFASVVTTSVNYVSNVVVPWAIAGVIVDGSYNLLVSDTGATQSSYRYYQSGGYVYVRLPDDSNPSGHTFEFTGQYETGNNQGIVTTNGNYITFNNIEVYGATTFGWLTPNMDIQVNNSSAYFSGRESLYCATYFQTVGCYFSTFNNNIFEYSNGGSSTTSWGQNVTVEGAYNTISNNTIAYGGMAGFDFLNYNPSTNAKMYTTPANYNLLLNNHIYQNSRRSLQNFDGYGYDAQVYNDGGNENQLIGNVIQGNEANDFSYPVSGQNAASCLYVSSEHETSIPSTNPHDIYLANNVTFDCTFAPWNIGGAVGSDGTPHIYNVWVINNTVFGDSNDGGYDSVFNNFDTNYGTSLHLYNNIFWQDQGAPCITFGSNSIPDANNNLYYNSQSTSLIHTGGTSYSLAGWQSAFSEDSNSVFGNPYFIHEYSDWHLQRTSLGQANDSAAIGIASPNYAYNYFNISSNGTTRTDAAIDTAGTDAGYHYSMVYTSSIGWPKSSQVGTDIQ